MNTIKALMPIKFTQNTIKNVYATLKWFVFTIKQYTVYMLCWVLFVHIYLPDGFTKHYTMFFTLCFYTYNVYVGKTFSPNAYV